MLLSKFHQTIITFNQVRNHHVPVIVSINIEYSENSICLMLRQNRQNTVVRTEKQNCRKSDALFVRFRVFKYKAAASPDETGSYPLKLELRISTDLFMRLCGTYHSDILVWNHSNVGIIPSYMQIILGLMQIQ